MTHANPLFPICGRTARLPPHLVQQALHLAGPHGPLAGADVERDLRCHLQAHTGGRHYALVLELAGITTGAVWTHWADDTTPAELTVLPDCPTTDPASREPCDEFAGHPGAHTHQLTQSP
jgi:hypothetical protein